MQVEQRTTAAPAFQIFAGLQQAEKFCLNSTRHRVLQQHVVGLNIVADFATDQLPVDKQVGFFET